MLNDGLPARDAQIRAILGERQQRRDTAEPISDVALVAAHPELMPELGEEIRKLRLIAAAREQAAQPIGDEVVTRSHHDSVTGSGSGRLEVRCPSCHAPMDVAVDTTLTDLTCSSCGSHFSLVDQSKATRMAPSLTKMGRFELIERLGVGGFGSVWKARDKELDRTVAIKIPRDGGMTGEEQEKFFREARAAAQLRHPSIVSVHEVGRDGDSVYIVSDFVRGVTLGDWLTGQQLTNREAAELCAKIADALHHAHEHGVVHRDLKPANIMIDGDGQPHLMDFGLARRDVGEVTVTMDGQVLGTPAYMSPEQAQGEAHTADRRSDVYSLGVILFQLITGELPFRGNARMLMHQVIHEEPPSPRKLNSNVRRDLETITLKCLEKSPDLRYQTAADVANELRRFLAGEPIEARPIGRIQRAARWAKRRPASAALLAMVAVVAVVGPIFAVQQVALRVQAQNAESDARNQANRADREAKRADREAKQAEEEASESKRLADYVGAQYAMSQGRISDAYRQITAAMASKPSWEYGRLLGTIVDQARRDWKLLARIPCDGPNWGCFVGTGPKWLVVAEGDVIKVFSLVRDEAITSATIPGSRLPCPLGADHLAINTEPGRVTIVSLPDLKSVASCEIPGRIIEIKSAHDGNYLAALNDSNVVRVFERNGKQRAERKFKPRNSKGRLTIDMSPSGKTVLVDPATWYDDRMSWNWEKGETTTFNFNASAQRLESDDAVLGYLQDYSTSEWTSVQRFDLKNKHASDLYRDNSFLMRGRPQLECAGNEGLARIAIVDNEELNIFDSSSDRANFADDRGKVANFKLKVVRYSSLCPHKSSPKFLTFDAQTRTIALAVDREILVFADMPSAGIENGASDDPTVATSIESEQSYYSLSAAGGSSIAVHGNVLEIVDLATLRPRQVVVAVPELQKEATEFAPWGVAATPDLKRFAVIWQEASGRMGEFDAKYFRKIVRVYDMEQNESKTPEGQTARVASEFELKELFGAAANIVRFPTFTPDGKLLAIATLSGECLGYNVADGALSYRFTVGFRTATLCQCLDPPLVGVGNFASKDNVSVWNLSTGKMAMRIAADDAVRRAALSPDGKLIYVGYRSGVLRAYQVKDGKQVLETKTRIAPVAIARTADHYLGFLPSESIDTVGSLVVAGLSKSGVLEELAPSFHIMGFADFGPNDKTIVFMRDREHYKAVRSADTRDAIEQFERTALNRELASQSSDLPDYLSRSAKFYFQRGMQFGDNVERCRNLEQALSLYSKLARDFPKNADYLRGMASCHELLGNVFQGLKDPGSVRAHDEAAVQIWTRLGAEFPADVEYREKLVAALSTAAARADITGNRTAAREQYEKAIAISAKLAIENPNSANIALALGSLYFNFANFIRHDGHSAESIPLYESAEKTFQDILAKSPANYPVLARLREALERKAEALAEIGRAEDAGAARNKAQQIATTLAKQRPASPDAIRVREEILAARRKKLRAAQETAPIKANSAQAPSGSEGTRPLAPTNANSQNSDNQHPITKSKTNPADAGKTIVITPKDAGNYEGKQVTVEFKVAASQTLPDKKISFLDWTTNSEDPQGFTVFIDSAASSKFKNEAKIDDPAEYYRTKQIRVSGTVKRYRERLEIDVTSPHQIEVVIKDKDKSAP